MSTRYFFSIRARISIARSESASWSEANRLVSVISSGSISSTSATISRISSTRSATIALTISSSARIRVPTARGNRPDRSPAGLPDELQDYSAVHLDHLAGHVRRLVGDEERDQVGDVLRLPEAAHRDGLQRLGPDLLR